MRFWIDIEDSAGARVGAGPIFNATRCTTRGRLSRAGEFSFEVPATDERASLITPRREALIYGMVNNAKTYLGGGVIEEIGTRIDANGLAMLTVKGGDLLRELGRISTGKVMLGDTGNNNIAALLALISAAPLSWGTSRENGSPGFKARLVYESCLNALVTIAEKTGGYFRLNAGSTGQRSLGWFYILSSSGILATMHGDADAIRDNEKACLITNIQVVEDSNDIKTRAIVFGAGEGDSAVTLAHASQWRDGSTAIGSSFVLDGQTYQYNAAGNYIVNATAEAAYGRDETAVAFKDIGPVTNSTVDLQACSNYLVVAAVGWLHARRVPYKSYRLSVAGLRSALSVGQTIRVQARRFRDGEKPINIDEELYVLEVQNTIDGNGVRVTGMTVANLPRWPVSGSEEIVREMSTTKVLSAHPQTGPNVDTIPYREHIDDTHNASLHFWLGEETTTVQSVIVRFRVDPLRATVAGGASTSSGPSSATSSAGGSSHQHSVTIPDHNHDIPDHQHEITIIGNGVGPLTYDVGYGAGGTAGGLRHNINLSDHTMTTDAGSGGTTSDDGGGTTQSSTSESTHTHNIAHTHTFTPLLNYGVYDDPGAIYAATDLEYNVNGGSYTAIAVGDAVSGASGWYQVDITAVVSTAAFRPTQAAHVVGFRVKAASKVGRKVQITAQIERRTSVQSIAVY